MQASNNRQRRQQIPLESTRGGSVARTIQHVPAKPAPIDWDDFPALEMPKPPKSSSRPVVPKKVMPEKSDRCYNLWEYLAD